MNKSELNLILDEMYAQSKIASSEEEIPVVAALLFPDGEVLYASNKVEKNNHPFHHAEIQVLEAGFKKTNSRYLKEAVLIVSLEPCLMCLGAIIKAGIKDLYYVLDDDKLGGLSHYHAFVDDQIRVHRLQDDRFLEVFRSFFAKLRK